ncbi:MAG: DUF2061 domain-containing protein [Saprospiraceae bacterium]|nr:DUF2061 domain-containing protein [Saprospiraceae bacterium]
MLNYIKHIGFIFLVGLVCLHLPLLKLIMLLEQISERKRALSEQAGKERMSRSMLKALTWRTVGTIDTMVISYIITGKLIIAFSIGTVELGTKMLLYYLHERAWNNIQWGKYGTKTPRKN